MYRKIDEHKKQGLNKSQVARRLGVNVKTVNKYWDMDMFLSIIVGVLLAMLYMRKGLGHVVIAHIIGDIILLSWNVFLR